MTTQRLLDPFNQLDGSGCALPGHPRINTRSRACDCVRLKEPHRYAVIHGPHAGRSNKNMNIQKMRRSALLTILAVAAAFLMACTGAPEVKPPASPSPASSPAASPAVSPTGSPASTSKGKADSLLGRWSGPEGTYLNVTAKGDKYTIEIANNAGPKTYDGTAKGDAIEFTRDGKTETVKAATGAETGMKGFEKETNCVVITKGKEGFCKK